MTFLQTWLVDCRQSKVSVLRDSFTTCDSSSFWSPVNAASDVAGRQQLEAGWAHYVGAGLSAVLKDQKPDAVLLFRQQLTTMLRKLLVVFCTHQWLASSAPC